MLKLIEKVKNAMEASEAAEAMNELMGHDRAKQGSMKECLSALLKAAGVNHAAEVYRAREGRVGGSQGLQLRVPVKRPQILGLCGQNDYGGTPFPLSGGIVLKKTLNI